MAAAGLRVTRERGSRSENKSSAASRPARTETTVPLTSRPRSRSVSRGARAHKHPPHVSAVASSSAGAWLKSEETVAMKTKRADFAAAYLRGRMVVAGGLGHEPSALDTVEAFHPQRKKWERLAPMNFPRCSTSSIVIRDRLLVVGGVNQVPSSAHEILYVKEEEYL